MTIAHLSFKLGSEEFLVLTGEGVASFLRWAIFCATRVEVLVQGSILASAVEWTILYNTVQYCTILYSII